MDEIKITVEKYPDDRDLLIPCAIAFRYGEGYDISCYEDSAEIVSEYVKRYEADLLCDEAIEFLAQGLNLLFCERGYTLQLECDEVYLLNDKINDVDCSQVVNSREAAQTENLCEIDLNEAAELGQEAFVIVEDGRVVSVAVENYTHKGQTEIAVETADEYRRRGYAKAVSTALCNDIISSGGSVTWHCSADNTRSCALAEALGFKTDGREIYFCFFAD